MTKEKFENLFLNIFNPEIAQQRKNRRGAVSTLLSNF